MRRESLVSRPVSFVYLSRIGVKKAHDEKHNQLPKDNTHGESDHCSKLLNHISRLYGVIVDRIGDLLRKFLRILLRHGSEFVLAKDHVEHFRFVRQFLVDHEKQEIRHFQFPVLLIRPFSIV